MNFTIRRVDVRNTIVQQAITAMDRECFPADAKLVPSDGQWWVAFNGKEEAGFAGISLAVSQYNSGYLCRAGVLPRFRGHGLQARLIRLRLKYAKSQGWSRVITDTHANPVSSNNLIRCGFRLYTPTYPWSFANALYWTKNV